MSTHGHLESQLERLLLAANGTCGTARTASDPKQKLDLARHGCLYRRRGCSEGALERRLESRFSSDCLPGKGGLDCQLAILLWDTTRNFDRVYDLALASAQTLGSPQERLA